MKKNLGLLLLLILACAVTYSLNDRFLAPVNIENVLRRTALFALISIGAAFVITSGGIDLSIGSMVCLVGTLLPWLTTSHGWAWLPSILLLLFVAALLGASHGLLITKLHLQPFIVTLCGLLLYRGITRGLTGDQTQGFGLEFESLRSIALTKISFGGLLPFAIPSVAFITVIVALIASFTLNRTRYGLYLRALGRNEVASRYSGINTDLIKLIAYVICATLAGASGILFILDVNSAQPSDFGNFYELYAIAAAVLGGCSLRGGEASIAGVLLGAALMQVLRNAIVLLDIPTQLEFAIIGGVILIGVSAEEIVRKTARRVIA
ncbi:MAG: Ribose transport system permease protein RbsC [Pseudomonadota bacterium]|jgi:ribose transport system permease protein